MTVSEEKRRHPRVGFATRIAVVLNMDGEQVKLDGNSKDLSLKGVFVNTDKEFSLGTQCSVEVYLTGSIEEIKLLMQGTIVRKTEKGIGVDFNSMDVDTYSHLKNIVRYNRSDDLA